MLTCPGKAAFEAAGGNDDGSPPLLPDYEGSSYARGQQDQWPSIRGDPQIPRKKQRRPKAPKIASQDPVRPALDMSIHAAGHEQFYPKMQLETPPQLPPPLPHSSLPPYQVPSHVREQKLLQQGMLQAQTSDLQQIILQREEELIKQERLLFQQEEELQLEEQAAQDVPQQEEVVPPPLAVVGSAAMVPQDDLLTENSVSDVAANVAISTEPSPVEVPKKRSRPFKGRTPSMEMKFVSTPSNDNVSFTPKLHNVPPEPVKVEEKPKSSNRKRKVSESAQILTRTPVRRRERTKSRTEEEQTVPLPMETPGSKINYATTSITTENVIPHKRIKKRPNYALMNDDADDANSKGRKTDVNVASPDVAPPRIKRSRIIEENEEKEEVEEEDDDDDDDEFAPKHISKKAARLKQESSEPGKISNIFTVRNNSCGKVMFSQASVILSTGGVCIVRGGAWQRGCWRDDHCCRRYASYWNAFLFILNFFELNIDRCLFNFGHYSR